LREVGDHEDRDNAEYSRRHTIQDLDRDQRTRVVGERVENGANRQRSECDEQERLSTPRPRFFPASGFLPPSFRSRRRSSASPALASPPWNESKRGPPTAGEWFLGNGAGTAIP
jgi:hypothetical protein